MSTHVRATERLLRPRVVPPRYPRSLPGIALAKRNGRRQEEGANQAQASVSTCIPRSPRILAPGPSCVSPAPQLKRVEPLLIARRVLREQLGVLHRQLLEIVRNDALLAQSDWITHHMGGRLE
jgi:hypothetical protein